MNQTTKSELTRLSELIDLIYQGATDFSAWQQATKAISEWVDASTGAVLTPTHTPEMGGFNISYGLSPQLNEMWATKFAAQDIWAIRAIERNLVIAGNVLRDQQLVTEEEFLSLPWSQDFLTPAGFGRILTGIVFAGPENRNVPVVVTCLRPFERPFTQQDADKLSLLIPHISRAIGVMFRLRDAEFCFATSLLALDQLASGVLLFGADGSVSFANRAARRIIEVQDGLRLRKRPGRCELSDLLVGDNRHQETLDDAIRESISPDLLSTRHFAKAISITRPSGKAPFSLHFSSLPHGNEFGVGHEAPRAIAFLNDSAGISRIDAALLKSAFGLSSAEVRTAELIANGSSNEEIASARNVTLNTIKTQLRHIYEKTGTNTRARLVKLLLTLAVGEP